MCPRTQASVELRISAKVGAVLLAHPPEERMSYTAGGGRGDEHGHGIWVPVLMPWCLRAGRCWRWSAWSRIAPVGQCAGSCNGHLLPILGFSIFNQNCPSCSFSPFTLISPEVFFPWKSKAGMSHPLPLTGARFPPALPHHFPWAQGSLPVLAEGTTHSPESSNREFGKNNPPGWLLLPSFAGGWS